MDTQRWELAGSIFERLLGAPQEKREVLLETLCGTDDELKNVVMSMLQSESSAQRFDRALAAHELPTATVDPIDSADSLPGSRVGPWLLVRRIGTGGMGVVWLGERVDGQFEQRAALKLIKRGMDSEAVLKRFLRERQILARLVHPHIAHLLDGGIAADGRPYFAMEYVEGLPLLRYCHERGIHLEERIRLFLRVCDAVQFAHANHVVHRDLKPSNILITASGDVKLLDFGIAKLLESDAGPEETITQLHRERPMTPMYAAPEQIRGDRISEATDVYALGCVLYELLTGQPARDLSKAANLKEVLQIIETTDPVAPSRLKLASMPVARKRLRGDLDTIVLTALRRDPARRYASAEALAADLKNYLDGKPIFARRDSVLYLAWKSVRRHRTGLAAVAAVAAIAAATLVFELRDRLAPLSAPQGASMAIVDFNNLSQSADNAWLAPALAEMLATELTIGSKVHVLPDELVRQARADLDPPRAGGYAMQSLATLRKRLGADFVLSGSYLVGGEPAEKKVRLDLALQDTRTGLARATVGQSGAFSDLPRLVERVGASLRAESGFAPEQLTGEQSTDKAQPPSTDVARSIGLALDALRRFDPARARDELLQAEVLAPGYAPTYVYLAQAWKSLGFDSRALAAAKQAELHAGSLPKLQQLQIARQVALQQSQWAEAIKTDRQLLELDPTNPDFQLALVEDYLTSGNYSAAEAELDKVRAMPGGSDRAVELKAAEIAQRRGDSKAQAQHAQLALQFAEQHDAPAIAAKAKRYLAISLDQMGEHDRAEALLLESIAGFQRSSNPKEEAGARTSLGILLQAKNHLQEARASYQQALELFQRIGDRNGIAAVYSNVARMLWASGDRDGAEAASRQVLAIRKEKGDIEGQGWAMLGLAQMQLDDAASDETLEAYRQAIALDEQAAARPQLLFAQMKYIEALQLRGDLDAAHQVCASARDEAKRLTNPVSVMELELQCASVMLDRGEVATATAGITQVLDHARENHDEQQPADADLLLAHIDMGNKQFGAARAKLERVIAYFAAGNEAWSEAEAQAMLALCYAALHEPALMQGALTRARGLRSAITIRRAAAVIDRWLAQSLGDTAEPRQAISRLHELADEAEMRQWLKYALEARLAAVQLMERQNDPALTEQRAQLEAAARKHDFGWILSRLGSPSNNGR